MNLEPVMARLEAAGTESRRAIYRRRGAPDPLFGVSSADLRAEAKAIRTDHDLALALWATGNADARMLACMVADPLRMTEHELDDWLAEVSYHVLVDEFVKWIASREPGVRSRMQRWIESDRDWTAQAGWDLVGVLAAGDLSLDDAFFLDMLDRIERDIGRAGNRTRHAMNGAVINIGIRNRALRTAAQAAAARIGPVVVDHGQTGCVTPPAAAYIARTVAHRERQATRRATAGRAAR